MLYFDLKETHEKLVDQSIDRFKRDETLAKGLKMANPRTQNIYTTLKIHNTGNPERPVVSLKNI